MKLSLSGRLIEVDYRYCEMSLPDFAKLAARCGYDAVELRSTQIDSMTSEEADAFHEIAQGQALQVSAAFAPSEITKDDAGLARIRGFAEILGTLECDLIKLWFEDVSWIQAVCDTLLPLGIGVISQTHANGPLETVDSCVNAVKQVDRENFCLQYDAVNFFEVGEDYGENSVRRLGGSIRQLSVQNCSPATAEDQGAWESGGRHYKRCLLSDESGLDYDSVFRGLRGVGFEGYVVLNEPKPALMATEAFAKHSRDVLAELIHSIL